MGYVVKAVSASGAELWVTPSRPETRCIFGVRKEASIFRTPMQAQTVIEALAEKCERYGFLLEVNSAGDELLSAGQTTRPRLSATPQERAVREMARNGGVATWSRPTASGRSYTSPGTVKPSPWRWTLPGH